MPKITWAAAVFSVNTFAAAMLALFIGLAAGLPMPYWAMTTAYIVSQPLSGAVRSKAIFRLAGTLLGAAAAIAMVPNLVNSPLVLSLALSAWVGACLTVSLLDRTPRSYVLMLAGYTAAIIGFPGVSHPEAIFDTAVARVVEIGLGIGCATLVHSLVFPRPVGEAIRTRLGVWMADADRWALDILRDGEDRRIADDRRHLAAAASEIRLLATHLPFDTSDLRETIGHVRALNARMHLLIPLLSGISERMARLADHRDPEVRDAINAVARWIAGGGAHSQAAPLRARLRTLAADKPRRNWTDLLVESLLVRLEQLVALSAESHALLAHMNEPRSALSPDLQTAVDGAGERPMHADLPLAALSGLAALLAVLAPCLVWILGGWADGATAAIMAAVFCCFFAALDDPVPAILNFGVFLLGGIPLGAIYMFAILPSIDGFLALCLVMAPPLLALGLLVPDPRLGGSAMPVIMGFLNAIGLQETFNADFASFLNINLGQFVGMASAVLVTAAIRSMGVDAAVSRLERQIRRGVAALARAPTAPSEAEFASRLVDRLGLLTPKLAGTGLADGPGIAEDALRNLRIGMNLVAVQSVRGRLQGEPRRAVDDLLVGVARHFQRRKAPDEVEARQSLLGLVDQALRLSLATGPLADPGAVNGLVGLRLNLFPGAPAFEPPASEAVR